MGTPSDGALLWAGGALGCQGVEEVHTFAGLSLEEVLALVGRVSM